MPYSRYEVPHVPTSLTYAQGRRIRADTIRGIGRHARVGCHTFLPFWHVLPHSGRSSRVVTLISTPEWHVTGSTTTSARTEEGWGSLRRTLRPFAEREVALRSPDTSVGEGGRRSTTCSHAKRSSEFRSGNSSLVGTKRSEERFREGQSCGHMSSPSKGQASRPLGAFTHSPR